jgi:hypothetical protein
MDPAVWGPPTWFFLHSVTFTYPLQPTVEDKLRIKKFFNSLEYILPCSICRVHYSEHIRQYPIDEFIHTREDLVHWLIDIHNMVNISLGKRKWTYEEALTHFENYIGKKIVLKGDEHKFDESKLKDYKMHNYKLYQRPKCDNQGFIYLGLLLLFFVIFAVCVWYKRKQ